MYAEHDYFFNINDTDEFQKVKCLNNSTMGQVREHLRCHVAKANMYIFNHYKDTWIALETTCSASILHFSSLALTCPHDFSILTLASQHPLPLLPILPLGSLTVFAVVQD